MYSPASPWSQDESWSCSPSSRWCRRQASPRFRWWWKSSLIRSVHKPGRNWPHPSQMWFTSKWDQVQRRLKGLCKVSLAYDLLPEVRGLYKAWPQHRRLCRWNRLCWRHNPLWTGVTWPCWQKIYSDSGLLISKLHLVYNYLGFFPKWNPGSRQRTLGLEAKVVTRESLATSWSSLRQKVQNVMISRWTPPGGGCKWCKMGSGKHWMKFETLAEPERRRPSHFPHLHFPREDISLVSMMNKK